MAPWTGVSPSQSVERTDGTRTGTDTWQQASAASVKIVSTAHDTHDQDVADMINSCLKKDGGNEATGNIGMGGFSLTGLGGIVPTSNDGAALGSTSLQWSDLFLASGAVVNFNNGDVTVTHASNALAFAGGSSGYTFDALISPASSDGAALGSASVMWSDLFLASGAVINFNNGDVTITHSANTLTFAGAGVGGYQFDAGVMPTATDAAALGDPSKQFADLYLAEGGVINWDNGDVTLTQSGNSLTVAGGNLIFPGTATNDSAGAGVVGEVISSQIDGASQVSLTTNTTADVTSISLTAGDWDVWGNVVFNPAGGTTITQVMAGISLTSGTFDTIGLSAPITGFQATMTTGTVQRLGVVPARMLLSSTTTVYLSARCTFGTSTMGAYGWIQARRAR